MAEESWRPPEWMYRNKRPASDDAYFENMARIIFLAGLSWRMIDEKWPNFRNSFNGFSIAQVSKFDEKDITRLIGDKGIVRNRAKIMAVIDNAKQFQNIKREYGSFQSYLDSLDKSNNYASVIKVLGKEFSRMGPSSSRIVLYSIGENIKHPEE